jgi:SAM-dependent methyltransferase
MSTKPPAAEIPLPPFELRRQVSPITDNSYYDNPTGDYIWGPLDIPPLAAGEAYRKVFDFGCGCGREARQLILQREPPKTYVGLDINAGMVDWCQKNLQSDRFQFFHLDAWSYGYGSGNTRMNRTLPIRQFGLDFTIIEGNSVFTHNLADQSEFYLDQMRMMLAPRGIIRATWFFINKQAFPTMGEHQNTLFIDESDLTLAVYYDWNFFRNMVHTLGYSIARVTWSHQLGFHNIVYLGLSKEFQDISDETPPAASVVGF